MGTKMTREQEIRIIMADRCMKAEAERFIKNGAIIYEDPEDWIQTLKDSDVYEGETIQDARNGAYECISVVTVDNHEYLIEYVI